VILREFLVSDAQSLLDCLNDDRVTRYITSAIPQPYLEQDAKCWVDLAQGNPLIKAIEHEGVFIGCISATVGAFEYNRSAEIGYWLGYSFWDQGLATLAVNQFVADIFNRADIERLSCSVVCENIASRKVLEKNGFGLEGVLTKASCKHGVYYDEYLMAKLSS